jgi:hypothetical protein
MGFRGVTWRSQLAAALLCGALLWLGVGALQFGLRALLRGPSPDAPINAVDLQHRFDETRLWFDGQSAYALKPESAVYPPAAYPLLWLAVGWGDFRVVRIGWAVLSLFGLAMLMLGMSRAAAPLRVWRWPLALLPIALVATQICLGLGQLTLMLLPRRTPLQQAVLIALLVVALIKPSIGLPFAALCLLHMSWRERVALVSAYVVLTLFAAQFQAVALLTLIGQWQRNTAAVIGSNDFGYANLNWALTKDGLAGWNAIASLGVLGAYGVWAWLRRDLSLLPALAICALIARLWAYHSSYDDLLVMPAVLALCLARPRRVARSLALAIALCGVVRVQPLGYAQFGGDGFAWIMAALWLAAIGVLAWPRTTRSTISC